MSNVCIWTLDEEIILPSSSVGVEALFPVPILTLPVELELFVVLLRVLALLFFKEDEDCSLLFETNLLGVSGVFELLFYGVV